MRKLFVVTTLTVICATGFSQVPTTDAAAINQMIVQIKQIRDLESKFKGDRGLWNFLNGTAQKDLSKFLPAKAVDALKPLGQLDPEVTKILEGVIDRKTMSAVDIEKLQRAGAKTSTSNKTFEVAAARADNIQKILERAGDPNLDVKGLDELRLRMQAETALIQADMVRMQALSAAREAQEQFEAEQRRASLSKSLRGPAIKNPPK
jgi:type IV secretion system protein VirB5